tara:strand:+ start:5931 stop:6878 length:948 start_codon:yes stop_codon:yes gene_type:complete
MILKAKPKLLIVGGTGFIGYHLALEAKKRGWNVSSLSLNNPKKNRYIKGVNYLRCDVGNLNLLKKVLKGSYTYVVNLGGYVMHSFFSDKKTPIIKTHFIGLINLTKILSKRKIKKFIQIGSSMEYGDAQSPQKENIHGLPNSTYALAKLGSTQFLLTLYKTKKFPVTILRFFQVYGPKQDQNRIVPQIITGCLSGKKFPTSEGNQIRDFCYIDDVINAIFLSLKSSRTSGEIFNIGFGKPIKIRTVINKIRKILGKGKPQFGKVKYRKDENMKLYPNIKKAKKKLKWKPQINFNSGVKTVIDSFRNKNEKTVNNH